jgi:hypothetical protein
LSLYRHNLKIHTIYILCVIFKCVMARNTKLIVVFLLVSACVIFAILGGLGYFVLMDDDTTPPATGASGAGASGAGASGAGASGAADAAAARAADAAAARATASGAGASGATASGAGASGAAAARAAADAAAARAADAAAARAAADAAAARAAADAAAARAAADAAAARAAASNNNVYLKGGRENKYCIPTGDAVNCTSSTRPSTAFKLNDIGSGEYTLQYNNKYCSDHWDKVVCNRDAVGQWEKFKGTITGDVLTLRGGRDNKYCSDHWDKVVCNRDAVGQWEKFKIENP